MHTEHLSSDYHTLSNLSRIVSKSLSLRGISGIIKEQFCYSRIMSLWAPSRLRSCSIFEGGGHNAIWIAWENKKWWVLPSLCIKDSSESYIWFISKFGSSLVTKTQPWPFTHGYWVTIVGLDWVRQGSAAWFANFHMHAICSGHSEVKYFDPSWSKILVLFGLMGVDVFRS